MSSKLLVALFCLSSIAYAACNADDVTCEDPIRFEQSTLCRGNVDVQTRLIFMFQSILPIMERRTFFLIRRSNSSSLIPFIFPRDWTITFTF